MTMEQTVPGAAPTKISCVTVCRNDKDGLLATVESALEQVLPLHEMVIIDGNSTDGTKELLPVLAQRFEEKGICFHAMSEPDTGIYNGMNKGIRAATGDWLIFMNAGDVFASDTVLQAVFADAWPTYADAALIYGDYLVGAQHLHRDALPPAHIKCGMPTSHQSCFFRAEGMKKRGYDETFRISADYEYLLYLYTSGRVIRQLPVEICIYDDSGLSSVNVYDRLCEKYAICTKYGVAEPTPVMWVKKAVAFVIQKMTRIKK